MNVTLIAPHQDDEIISSFLYLSYLKKNGSHVTIIFATNGDYRGKEEAKCRFEESCAALQSCGIGINDIYYMGYADTGMRFCHSFLYQLYYEDRESVHATPYSSFTYHPNGGITIHRMFHDTEALYCRDNFVCDLIHILLYFKTDILIMPSIYDFHGDHFALNRFLIDIIKDFPTLKCFTYLIHAGNDNAWPPRRTPIWRRPDIVSIEDWNRRFIISGNYSDVLLKRNAIAKFKSQLANDTNGFLMSFAKQNEFFIPIILP